MDQRNNVFHSTISIDMVCTDIDMLMHKLQTTTLLKTGRQHTVLEFILGYCDLYTLLWDMYFYSTVTMGVLWLFSRAQWLHMLSYRGLSTMLLSLTGTGQL